MKEFIKKNFALLLAFSLPILLIIIVAFSTYLPSLFVSTHYNFIYATCVNNRNYSYSDNCNSYLQKYSSYLSVVDNKLVVTPIDTTTDSNKDGISDFNKNFNIHIFLHDTLKNESREIPLEEAKSLNLSNLLTSPDGVTVSSNYSRGVDLFPFGGGPSYYGFYLSKGKGKSKLNLINNSDQYYYQNNFEFLGWVTPGRN
jgi:hypothetical protein